MRVTIVGAGIMGLSTAWALARDGHAVTVLDQAPVPNPLGTSVDQHRLIRSAYGAARGYTLMVDDAFAAWDRMWADLGRRHYDETGVLAITSEGQDDWVRQSADTLEALGRPVTWLDREAFARRFPLLTTERMVRAFHMPTGGALHAGAIVADLARHLPGRGVAIRAGTPVVDVEPDRARVRLADGTVEDADALVVAAGAWIGRLVPSLAGRVVPSRQIVVYMTPPPGTEAAWAAMPMILEIDPREGFYLVPPVPGTGLKIGDHRFSLQGDPDRDREATAADLDAIVRLGGTRIRDWGRYRAAAAKTCFYTVERKEAFVVERLAPRAWALSPCSGHGFKFGAVLGEATARALTDETWATAFPDWAAGRA